jgi:hypothetical protein
MITDHSSAGFEFLLRDRPLVRIHRPQLIQLAKIHRDYVALLASASHSVIDLPSTLGAVERALAAPEEHSAERRFVASQLFYLPGSATERSVRALYEAMELAPTPEAVASGGVMPTVGGVDGSPDESGAVAVRTYQRPGTTQEASL